MSRSPLATCSGESPVSTEDTAAAMGRRVAGAGWKKALAYLVSNTMRSFPDLFPTKNTPIMCLSAEATLKRSMPH